MSETVRQGDETTGGDAPDPNTDIIMDPQPEPVPMPEPVTTETAVTETTEVTTTETPEPPEGGAASPA